MNKNDQEIHLELLNLQKSFAEVNVLNMLNMNIHKGEFIAIVGKSGCGKSTLLRLLSGLEKPSAGEIVMEGKPLAGLNRQACIMFQDGRLLPWKRVLHNVGLGLKGDHQEEAMEVLRHVGLENKSYEWPSRLSGGQKQRVALARALIHKPSLLLLDEPLGALDALTRLEMQSLIEEIWAHRRFTALLVTHDVEEAVALADRVIVLQDGKIAQEIKVSLPRPRGRDRAAFASIVNRILKQIIGAPKPVSGIWNEGPEYASHSVPRIGISSAE
ncbi:ABC transporter ATP-binding protein [Paenibacillus caui]|uniref:ABC transporter ATP-binding protein n=1 Tax=Paenibacillus caui TaxID=2873927 RepID=UPI001CA7CED1|nr:ATP-binding cassette domain-containing protein [Paenibacillus caui]